jgi:hypothetical protein
LSKRFDFDNIVDFDNVGDTFQVDLHGKKSYIYEDKVEGFIGEFVFNIMNKEGSEKDIVEGIGGLDMRKNWKKTKRKFTKGMHMGMTM